MNAYTARQIALDANTRAIKKQLDLIMKQIGEACTKGCYFIDYYESILPAVKNRLSEEGYAVSAADTNKDGITIKISWG